MNYNHLMRRHKRPQVARACDYCRQHRIKCDNSVPCSNCKAKERDCSNASIERLTLPRAYRDIERLRLRVQELELELSQARNEAHIYHNSPLSQLAAPSGSEPSTAIELYDAGFRGSMEGIYIRTPHSANKTWYGSSSLFFFIGRMSSFLSATVKQTHSSDQIPEVNPTATLLDGPAAAATTPLKRSDMLEEKAGNDAPAAERCDLSPMQEEYFIDLYWQSYHASLFPIINEAEFKEYHRSLWTSCGNVRKPSALVDIVVALCMQLGFSVMPATMQQLNLGRCADATVAGRCYYLRCQKLLAYELENPSISTLQCQLLSAVYLCCGTFQNMADSACSTAVRTAYALGIHLDAPENMSLQERDMQKRLWWALFALDSKFGMKLGRPFRLHQSSASPGLPDHHVQAAARSGSSFAPLGDNLTWLSFDVEYSKLFLAARAVYAAHFKSKSASCNDQAVPCSQPVEKGQSRPSQQLCMARMEDWADAVPSILQLKRKNNARPFSTNEPDLLNEEQLTPIWLQRQRLVLELMYHNLCTNLYRPFISFGSAPKDASAEENARECARHASTLTQITYQALVATPSSIACWHETFQWQWNAAMTLVGYVLACPQDVLTEDIRKSISVSIDVFDLFGKSFAGARSAASIMRKLSTTISPKVQSSAENRPTTQVSLHVNEATSGAGLVNYEADLGPHLGSAAGVLADSLSWLDDIDNAQLQEMFNLAFDVDSAELNRSDSFINVDTGIY
ncbi:hypothetical protein QQS21_012469 [Conoideocrella luteorostrata]|uniref:Zn(2)-C6 fungal-type domain-containing protein n=1 Tax=Conoideocrella luteorostrata TaxID=1105319 RepID=A0AAJ0CC83_9HYPO|nr:hypothetical protein QQS21_012469 [Conoideocrella luteorostrata]